MKKRGTALLLALILGICMAGCGAQSEETDDSSQTAQTPDDTDTGNSQEEEQGSGGLNRIIKDMQLLSGAQRKPFFVKKV